MTQWKNRIIKTGQADPKTLTANPINFRKHPTKQKAALNGSLDSLGWLQQVIVNQRTGRIIDGHLRVEEAISHGEESVPVQWVDLTEEEEGQALLSLDPIAAMADTNKKLMGDILAQIKENENSLAPYLESIANSAGLDLGDLFGPAEDPPIPENKYKEQYGVIVICESENHQEEVFNELSGSGYNCKVVVT